MPFVAPKGATTNTASNAANRTSFRPPWVKEDGSSPLKPVSKTVPWAKKTATTTDKDNGEKSTTPATTLNSKKPVESTVTKKVVEPVKKTVVPAVKKAPEPVIKKPVEPVKKAPVATVTKTAPNSRVVKKPSPPSSSSSEEEEEEEDDEDEEETESEEEETEEEESDEEDEEEESVKEVKKPSPPATAAAAKKPTPTTTTTTNNSTAAKKPTPAKPAEKTSELEQRFSLEKPKLRPVVIKRDKSLKKIEDDDEAEEGETEEERARRLRFKLEKPKLRHVKREEKPLPSKSSENILKIRPVLKKVNKIDEIIKEPKEEPKPEFKTKTLRKTPSIKREPSMKNVPAPPPLPSLVPKAPPPPPGLNGAKTTLTPEKKAALEKLKSRPRRRPDWSEMMKEVESGKKLRHVECNDRSAPIVKCKSITKVDDKFIYETEKDNSHNKLLKQIQGGIKLRPTKTNDRSKPVLDGLRKFRRQMTIEEQLQRSQSKINMMGDAPPGSSAASALGAGSARTSIVSALSIDDLSEDELDDIDKVRDDLQSTKQMLALELRNREAQERENKKLLAQIATLEAELVREKSREKNLEYGSNVIVATMEATPVSEECYLKSLKEEADEARQMAKDLEKKYLETGELLDQAKTELEEQKRQIQKLERQLAQALQRSSSPEICLNGYNIFYANDEHYNYKTEAMFHIGEGGSLNGSRRPSDVNGDDSAAELEASESDPDEPEEKKQERRERKAGKEVKVLRGKLSKVKVKEETAKKEKQALKEAMKKNQLLLKEEHKKFKKLEKEVHKMAASMKEENSDEDEDEEPEDKEEDVEEEEEEEESEEESEESESESEAESASESESEDASNVAKKNNLEPRVKKHEGRLNAMKKCNVLLQANVDNLQDEISQVRSKAANLQAELDAVLADLGL